MEEVNLKMSLILARENASNLLDTCSRTPKMEWRTSDKSKGRKHIAKGNPFSRLNFCWNTQNMLYV
jgi:hypothetical protein